MMPLPFAVLGRSLSMYAVFSAFLTPFPSCMPFVYIWHPRPVCTQARQQASQIDDLNAKNPPEDIDNLKISPLLIWRCVHTQRPDLSSPLCMHFPLLRAYLKNVPNLKSTENGSFLFIQTIKKLKLNHQPTHKKTNTY